MKYITRILWSKVMCIFSWYIAYIKCSDELTNICDSADNLSIDSLLSTWTVDIGSFSNYMDFPIENSSFNELDAKKPHECPEIELSQQCMKPQAPLDRELDNVQLSSFCAQNNYRDTEKQPEQEYSKSQKQHIDVEIQAPLKTTLLIAQPLNCLLTLHTSILYSFANSHENSNITTIHQQSTGVKRPCQIIEETVPTKNKKHEETTTSISTQLHKNCNTKNNVFDLKELCKICRRLQSWNCRNFRDSDRKTRLYAYCPVFISRDDYFQVQKYNKIGDEKHHKMLKSYFKSCMHAYKNYSIHNKILFGLFSRTSAMDSKIADCKAVHAEVQREPSHYKYIEEMKMLKDYYPEVIGDILKYIDKHGPMVTNAKTIKEKWKETLGDIYIRKKIASQYSICEKIYVLEKERKYALIFAAIRMIMAFPEVYIDFSNITYNFIRNAFERQTTSRHYIVVNMLHIIIMNSPNKDKLIMESCYRTIYNEFSWILQQKNTSSEEIVIQLYTEMYKSLAYFYEKAKVCREILEVENKKKKDETEYYLLAGKCIIKPQRYFKCTANIDVNKTICDIRHQIIEETDKWTISEDVQKHYHIHYVDNTKQKYTRLCMPMYAKITNPRNCIYLHTIDHIVDYIRKIYNIETEEKIIPYMQSKETGKWSYVEKHIRNITIKEFSRYNVVFYYIEEGPKENYFAFIEFESYKKPSGKTVRIPLFLSPLLCSLDNLYPFEKETNNKNVLLETMKFSQQKPNVYAYNKRYKETEYSSIHHYYSNLYIRIDNADWPTVDCYIMDNKEVTNVDNGNITVEWYVKISSSVDEYTHCILSDGLVNNSDKYNQFINAAKSQEYAPDSVLYGFGLQTNSNNLDNIFSANLDSRDNNYSKTRKTGNLELCIVPIKNIATHKNTSHKNESDRSNANPEISNSNTKKLKEKKSTKDIQKEKCVIRYKHVKNKRFNNLTKKHDKKESTPTSFISNRLIVFRNINTTCSALGVHNEILNLLVCKYNI